MEGLRTGCVYVLIDPRDGRVRYVGKTILSPPEKRLAGHISLARRNLRSRARAYKWIRALDRVGLAPVFRVVERVPIDDGTAALDAAERRWIARFRRYGVDLCNHTDGGTGGATMTGVPVSSSARAAISLANRRENNPERAERIAESKRRHWRDPEYRARMIEAGRRGTRATADRTRGKPGRPATDETKAKLRASLQGRTISDEVRAKISATHKANPGATHPEGWSEKVRKAAESKVRAHLLATDRTLVRDGMTRADIAECFGVPLDRVKEWRSRGVLHGGTRVGSAILFSADEVRAVLLYYGIGGDANDDQSGTLDGAEGCTTAA